MKSILITMLVSGFLSGSEILFGEGAISIGSVQIKVELARTEQELMRGLMFRKALPENRGMLFIYGDEKVRSFWMKNTFIPLSIGFFNKNKELIDVQDMAPVKSEMQVNIPTCRSRRPAMYALEVNSGWFSRNKIKMGTQFKFMP